MSSENPHAVPRDASNHRSQMLHRLSTHSSNASSSSRRGSTRVTKVGTPGNSPHNVQRRRTTASHTTRSYPRLAQESPYQTRDQRLWNYYNSYPMAAVRPMSWHPGSERLQTVPHPPLPLYDPALGNTISGLENLAVTGTPAPSVERSIQDAFSLAYGFPMSTTPTDYTQPGIMRQDDPSVAAISHRLNQPFPTQYPAYDLSQYVAQDSIYDMYNPTDYQIPQQSQSQLDYASTPSYPYPTSTELLWEKPPTNSEPIDSAPKPRLQRKKSKELVGIGLYNDREPNFMSTLDTDANRESLGKDLKLEETWQPPKEDADEGGEEAYSSDEAEEVPEVPIFNSAPMDSQTFFPTYGDLSNQSFFFNDDDQLGHDDPYVNYVALGQDNQAKVQPVAATGNFMWL